MRAHLLLFVFALAPLAAVAQSGGAEPPARDGSTHAGAASVSAPSLSASSATSAGWKLPALQFAAGAGAALVSAPATLWLSTALGTLSSNLVLAALPSFLLFIAIPPVAVTLAASLVGNWRAPGSSRFSPAVWATVGAQVLILAASIGLGASSRNFDHAALITLAELVILPAAATGTMRLTRPSPTPFPVESRLPPESRVLSLPVVSLAF